MPVYIGYAFQGWATSKENADKKEIKYNVGEEYKEGANITLYAVWEKLNIGEVVNYTPKTNQDSYTLKKVDTGYTKDGDKTLTRSNYTWKIMSINDDNTIDIMGVPTSSTSKIQMGGTEGYNNGVYILNTACNTLYSNTDLNLTARSIKIQDIENKMNSNGKTAITNSSSGANVPYGGTKYYDDPIGNYPKIADFINGFSIDDNPVEKNGLGVSDDGVNKGVPLIGNNTAKRITITQTGYVIDQVSTYYDSSEFYNLLFTTGLDFWVASRYEYCNPTVAEFGINYITTKTITGEYFYGSDNTRNDNGDHYLCPVVTIKGGVQVIKQGTTWNLRKV